MKVIIFPTSDRLGQASIIRHYHQLGHDVYVPRHGTLSLDWSTGAQWPSLLCRDPSTGKSNLDLHGLRKEGKFFGEDSFLEMQALPLSKNVPSVRICDEEEFRDTQFDVYHTLRGAENFLHHYKSLMDPKKSIWVSSTLNVWDSRPSGLNSRNIARILPAPYAKTDFGKSNVFDTWCLDIEYDFFDISRDDHEREKKLCSFNHNFHARQPEDYKLFCEMNDILEKKSIDRVVNYGGNIRAMGADIRYSTGGPVGNYETLSPMETIKKYKSISGVVHFKQTDWGGGVFFHSLFSHTPVITTRRYVGKSNSGDYLINDENSIHIETPQEAAEAVERLLDFSEFSRLSSGMKKMKDKLVGEEYWTNWKTFLERLT